MQGTGASAQPAAQPDVGPRRAWPGPPPPPRPGGGCCRTQQPERLIEGDLSNLGVLRGEGNVHARQVAGRMSAALQLTAPSACSGPICSSAGYLGRQRGSGLSSRRQRWRPPLRLYRRRLGLTAAPSGGRTAGGPRSCHPPMPWKASVRSAARWATRRAAAREGDRSTVLIVRIPTISRCKSAASSSGSAAPAALARPARSLRVSCW
jgi:hypothetical protein